MQRPIMRRGQLDNPDLNPTEARQLDNPELNPTEARQGFLGRPVLVVLAVSLALVIVALLVLPTLV
jgi:hypothetical protein